MLLSNWMTVERVVREESAGEAKLRRRGSKIWVEAAGRTARGRHRLDRRGPFASRQPLTAAWAAEERRESMLALIRPAYGYGGILHVSQAELKSGVRVVL